MKTTLIKFVEIFPAPVLANLTTFSTYSVFAEWVILKLSLLKKNKMCNLYRIKTWSKNLLPVWEAVVTEFGVIVK